MRLRALASKAQPQARVNRPAAHSASTPRAARSTPTADASPVPDEPDQAARLDAASKKLAEMSAAMDETKRRQDEIQRQQDALLDQLQRLSKAMDPEPPEA
jgi:hypothetical protein